MVLGGSSWKVSVRLVIGRSSVRIRPRAQKRRSGRCSARFAYPRSTIVSIRRLKSTARPAALRPRQTRPRPAERSQVAASYKLVAGQPAQVDADGQPRSGPVLIEDQWRLSPTSARPISSTGSRSFATPSTSGGRGCCGQEHVQMGARGQTVAAASSERLLDDFWRSRDGCRRTFASATCLPLRCPPGLAGLIDST